MNTPDSPALTIPGFAAAYSLKESWVRVAIRPGGLLHDLHHVVGKHVRFTEADCLAFEARTAATATNEPESPAEVLPADGEVFTGPTLNDLHRSIKRLARAERAAA